jgi:hypothetical protein
MLPRGLCNTAPMAPYQPRTPVMTGGAFGSTSDGALKRAITSRDRVCRFPGVRAEHKSAVREKVEHFERLASAVIQTEFDSVDAKREP